MSRVLKSYAVAIVVLELYHGVLHCYVVAVAVMSY